MGDPNLDRKMRAVVYAARRWKEARATWLSRGSDRHYDEFVVKQEMLSQAVSSYEQAVRIATATINQGGAT